MDHAGCVLWPLSKLLGRQFFRIMTDRALVTCTLTDSAGRNYMICRVLYANILGDQPSSKVGQVRPWWMTSGDIPKGHHEILFIPGDSIDSADGECSGIMYELREQDIYKTGLFDYFYDKIAALINDEQLSVSYQISTVESGHIQIIKQRRETFDACILSLIHLWRLGHQVTLGNQSLIEIFTAIDPPKELLADLREYHTLLSRGNNSFPKLVPLSTAELKRPYDIRYKFWRECELLSISTDLCYMYLGTGMPLMSVVMPIYGMTKDSYRNPMMRKRFDIAGKILAQTDESRGIIKSLGAISSGTRAILSSDRNIQTLIDTGTKDWSQYELQDVAGLIIMPYAGMSIYQVLTGGSGTIIKDSYLEALRNKLLEPSVFKQLIFNWFLTLCNLHFFGGIIHGDLHVGNVTMYTNYTGYEQKFILGRNVQKKKINGSNDNPNDSYQYSSTQNTKFGSGDSGSPGPAIADVYMQSSGEPYIGRIIDFSRAFITGKGPLLERHSHVSIQVVLDEQKVRLLRTFDRVMPDFYKNKSDIIKDFINTRPDWYVAAGALDELNLSNALYGALKEISSQPGGPSVPDEILEMLIYFKDELSKYIIRYIMADSQTLEYVTYDLLRSKYFDSMKCSTMTFDSIEGLPIAPGIDRSGFADISKDKPNSCMQEGNRCITSSVSFGTTITEDIYLALVDAKDKFPNEDKGKIRIMLDIHNRNDEWYSLADKYNGEE